MDDVARPVPKYYQIYETLLDQIKNGEFKEFDQFYSDTELVEKFNVSRGTIRESIRLLIEKGYLVREQGRGTFVTKPKIEQESDKLMGFTELMRKNDITPSARVLKKEIVETSLKIENVMELDEKEKVVHLERVRYGDKEPMIIERSYFVYEIFKHIHDMDLESNSIYELLYNHTDTRLGEAKQQISATRATEEEVKLLNVKLGSPLLLMKRFIKTKDDKFFQYSEDLYRSERINFVTITKPYDQYHDNQGLPLELNNES